MICKKCGKEFFEKYSELSNGNFCSEYCARSFARNQSPNGTKIVKCITCGKEIEVDKRASPKQCKCYNCRKYKKPIVTKKIEKNHIKYYCSHCNKQLNSKGKFCNNICKSEYDYLRFIQKWKNGEVDGSKSYKNDVSNYVRRYLWRKFNNKCSRCGWNTPNPITKKPILEIEHLDGDSTNNKEENLDLICPNCHSLTSTYKNLNRGKGNKNRLKYHKLI